MDVREACDGFPEMTLVPPYFGATVALVGFQIVSIGTDNQD
ncbi:hypothetical protein Z947_852 [Sulfitobacter geojensis]|nr:hypothetical protein Z947_852 [Sulfitobacter geojensis]